ncbi:MAG: FAD-binding protein [Candidatus Saccharimonadales bacterium]|jgi:delta24-sterol reductase
MEKHRERVTVLAAQVFDFYQRSVAFKIYHGSTNSTRTQVFKRSEMLDTSHLNHVLSIDPVRKVALVEPNVPMDALVRATLRYGLIPPVVMEFPGITVGGGVQGGAGESSSFRWGIFHSTCTMYEMICGDGQVVTCSPKKQSDLFYGTPGSYGTLGVMTAVEIQLIPAKKYVELTYLPVRNFDEAVLTLEHESKKPHDYIDGIMFSPDSGVIMVGKLSDDKQTTATRFTRARDEWFYLHAARISADKATGTESIPLVDYLFRYDRGAFWVGRYAFELLGVPFNALSRTMLNWMLHTRQLYQALQESGMSQHHIVQDLAIPLHTAAQFMRFVDKHYGIYPLWLCPLKTDTTSPFISSNLSTPLVINVGVWGEFIPSHKDFLSANRALEREVTRLGGKKWFYAHAYYPKNEFWKIYPKKQYDLLRQKYKTVYQPSVYDKVRVRQRFAIDTHRGVWRTVFRTAKLKIIP